MGNVSAGDAMFEREVRKVLDSIKSDKDKTKYVKMLKSTYRDRIDHINRIVREYD